MAKAQKIYTQKDNQQLDQDLKQLYDWVSRLEVVTENPNGSRVGRFTGEAVYLQSGGNHYVEICIESGTTTWRGVSLSNTP